MHESIKNRSIVVKIPSVCPIGDVWFYGSHVTKVYVSYGNMDDVRHAKSTPGGGGGRYPKGTLSNGRAWFWAVPV